MSSSFSSVVRCSFNPSIIPLCSSITSFSSFSFLFSSVATLSPGAEEVELPLDRKGLEPIPYARFPVRVPSEPPYLKWVVYRVDYLVFSDARHLHVVPVMGAVVCDHGQHMSFYLFAGVDFYNGVSDCKVRYPLPDRKAVGIILCGPYIALKVDIRFAPCPHYALGLHLYRLQIDRGNVHPVKGLGQPYGRFKRHRGRSRKRNDRQRNHSVN